MNVNTHKDRIKGISIKDAYNDFMGPGGLYLTDYLGNLLELKESDNVLDLGCGKGASSIYLAKTFGCKITAQDIWITEESNQKRFEEAGLDDKVKATYQYFRTMKHQPNEFNKVFALNSYEYFGTCDHALNHLLQFVEIDGLVGIANTNFKKELDYKNLPDHLKEAYFYIEGEVGFQSLHDLEWWAKHFEKSGQVEIVHAEQLENGYQSLKDMIEQLPGLPQSLTQPIIDDKGENFGVFVLVARKIKRCRS